MEQADVLAHFQSLNHTRIARLSELAPKSQQIFFDLLALLFHSNIPILPERFANDTPAGIVDFQPLNNQLDAAKRLNPSFQFKRHALRHYPIIGLYLINNNGLLNYQYQPNFDLWLVQTAGQTNKQQQALKSKLNVISNWAENLGITLRTRLLLEDKLNGDTFTATDLDNFYLNGLVIAGAVPLWWFVPPETDYDTTAKTLVEQRMLGHAIVIDFGTPPELTAQPLFDHSISLLYQSIEQGLTQLLPLLYQQYQLKQYPNMLGLSMDFKRAVYSGETEAARLDCRLLQLERLERSNLHFSSLKLARQSFYLQAKEPLSQKISQPRFPWRRSLMIDVCRAWHWEGDDFERLDKRVDAGYQQCGKEHQATIPIFQDLANMLNIFAKHQHIVMTDRQRIIAKKLDQFNNDKLNIIPSLPAGLLAKSPEEHLYLYRFEKDADWKLSNITLSSASQNGLYQHSSLLNVLAWAICNHVLTNVSRIIVSDSTNAITISTVKSLIQYLLRTILNKPIALSESDLLTEPALNHILLFANLERQPMAKFNQQGLKLSSLQNDPLNYAGRGQTLVVSIDGLLLSSWGEWQVINHEGITSPLETLKTLSNWWTTSRQKDRAIHVWCPSDTFGETISSRLMALYISVSNHYYNNPHHGGYIIMIADKYFQLQWQEQGCDYIELAHSSDVMSALSKTRTQYSASQIDPSIDPTGLISTLLSYQTPTQISLFLQLEKHTIRLYFIDEFGSLLKQDYLGLTESTLINHVYRFLKPLVQKNGIKRLRFFRLGNVQNRKWPIMPLPLPNSIEKAGYLPVKIIMATAEDNSPCTINCGPQHFSGNANEATLFNQVSEFMLSFRKANKHYPLYITELTFQQDTSIATYEYLIQKQRLEKLLNQT